MTDQHVRVIIHNIVKDAERVDKLKKKYSKLENRFRDSGGRFVKVTDSMVKSGVRQEKSMEKVEKKQRFLGDTSEKLGTSAVDVDKAMSKLGYSFDESGQVVDKTGKSLTKTTADTEKLRKQIGGTIRVMKPFRSEFLSVMFAGMAMTRVFTSLTRTSFEWFGITEILSTALGVLFMPIAEQVLDWALWFLDTILNMDPATQRLIGRFVLIIGVLGTVITTITMVVLAFLGLAGIFAKIMSPLGILLLLLGSLGIMTFGPELLNWFRTLTGRIEESEDELKKFGLDPEIVTGMISKLEEQLPKIVDFGKKIGESIFNGVSDFIKENPLIVVGAITGFWLGGPAGALVGGALGGLFGRLSPEKMDEVISLGKKALQGLLDGIVDNLDILESAITKIAEVLVTFVANNIDKFLKIGWSIAEAILAGVIAGLGNLATRGLEKITGKEYGRMTGEEVLRDLFRPEEDIRKIVIGPELMDPKKLQQLQMGGIVHGPRGSPVPILAHGGERVIPSGRAGAGEVMMNVTYNVTVSDRREFEEMLKSNNNKLTEDVRRIIKV